MVDGEAKSGGGGADGSPNNVAMPHEFEAITANAGVVKVDGLPITFSCFSRPGNDPMKRSKENQDSMTVIPELPGTIVKPLPMSTRYQCMLLFLDGSETYTVLHEN